MNPADPLYPLWAAVQNDPYDAGDSWATVTGLIKPLQEQVLVRRHAREIAEDRENPKNLPHHIWRLAGQALHTVLERSGSPGALREERFFLEVAGRLISGQGDALVLEASRLTDYKWTTVFGAYGSGAAQRRVEWTEQLNSLAFLARANGLEVNELAIVAIWRDWRPSEAERKRSEGYPQEPLSVIPIPVWGQDNVQFFLEGRVRSLDRALKLRDEALPTCSPTETWERPDAWACKKPKNVRARKLHRTKLQAQEDLRPGEVVEFRPGERPRCTGGLRDRPYCEAAPWCVQLKRWKAR